MCRICLFVLHQPLICCKLDAEEECIFSMFENFALLHLCALLPKMALVLINAFVISSTTSIQFLHINSIAKSEAFHGLLLFYDGLKDLLKF